MAKQPFQIINALAVPVRTRVPVSAIVAVAVLAQASAVAAAWPLIGVPVALAAAAYAVIVLGSPDRILRGRMLSPAEQQRTALLLAAVLFGLAGLGSTAVYGIELANRLEQQLRDEVDVVRTRGDLQLGQVFEECTSIACARATVVQMPGDKEVGIARFSGFALHDERLFGWRKALGHIETGTGSSTPPLSPQHSVR
jgi:hypothetical protein